jgi:hypothetical protein
VGLDDWRAISRPQAGTSIAACGAGAALEFHA